MFIVKPLTRLRGRTWPILQTAVAATAAWCLAVVVLPDGRPSFASIAAVICLGASHGQRGSKALQLVAGVVLGICVASALVSVIGAGPLQIGVMVALAMAVAVLLGGGELLTAESAVSAILIVSLDPGASDGFTVSRILEGVIGGGVALAVSSLLFPADPVLPVARAAQAVLAGLGREPSKPTRRGNGPFTTQPTSPARSASTQFSDGPAQRARMTLALAASVASASPTMSRSRPCGSSHVACSASGLPSQSSADDGTPARRARHDAYGLAAGDADLGGARREGLGAVGRQVAIGIRGIDLDDDPVALIGVADRRAPRDVVAGADQHAGQPREC